MIINTIYSVRYSRNENIIYLVIHDRNFEIDLNSCNVNDKIHEIALEFGYQGTEQYNKIYNRLALDTNDIIYKKGF